MIYHHNTKWAARGGLPAAHSEATALCECARRFDRQPPITDRSARMPWRPAIFSGGTHE